MPPGTRDTSQSLPEGGVWGWCVVFSGMWCCLPSSLQGCQRGPPFCTQLCEVLQRVGSEGLWVDKGSKMELTGAQEMLSLLPLPCGVNIQSRDQGLGVKIRAKGTATHPSSAKSSMTGSSPQPTRCSSSSFPPVRRRGALGSQSLSCLFHFLFYPGVWAGEGDGGPRLWWLLAFLYTSVGGCVVRPSLCACFVHV